MLYAAGEVPVKARDGLVRIDRAATEVFSPTTIASFEGKAITLNHPTEDVSPENWTSLAKGIVQNVRRGANPDDDYLLADLLITDASAIRSVRDGLKEVSAGYDADYEEIEPGRGRQTNIVGNHLALVERGRCGSRCAIGDSQLKNTKSKWFDSIRAAFSNRDQAEFEKVLTTDVDEDETEEEKKKRLAKEKAEKTDDTLAAVAKVTDEMSKLIATVDRLQGVTSSLVKRFKDEDDETEEEKKKKKKKDDDDATTDSASLATEVLDVFSRVELLSPGLHLPTFDAKATKQTTLDSLCLLKRKALSTALDGANRSAVTPFLGQTPDFKVLTCDAVASAFTGASEIVRVANNKTVPSTFDTNRARDSAAAAGSIAAINKRNAEFWNGRKN